MTDIVERLNDSLSAGYSELRKEAAVTIARLRAKLEAAEKKHDDVAQQLVQSEITRREISEAHNAVTRRLSVLADENTTLRAKIEAMEKQEPVAWARKLGLDVPSFGCVTDLKYRPSNIPESSYIPLYTLPGAQPAPSLASNNVSLISEGKTQPAPSVKDAIIDDLQSQFDTEGITEQDSGDALIRLSDAIAAVEDNFVQPAPSVPTALLVAVADLCAQMEIVSRVGFVDMPDDKDSCAAFCVAEGTWLELMSAIESLASALEAAPEAKP